MTEFNHLSQSMYGWCVTLSFKFSRISVFQWVGEALGWWK